MVSEYHLFERMPDGSSRWRDSVEGLNKVRLRLEHLSARSPNEFYAVRGSTNEIIAYVNISSAQLPIEVEALKRLKPGVIRSDT
jgi:hypothetical protein